MSESIVILGAARTPMGSFQGDFSPLAAHDLGGAAIRAAVERAGSERCLDLGARVPGVVECLALSAFALVVAQLTVSH